MGIHLAGKHALELQAFHFRGQSRDIPFDLVRGPRIGFLGSKFEQFSRFAQSPGEMIEALDDPLQFGPLPPQLLGPFRIVPDAGLFELAGYLLKTLMLVVVIKDTSSRNRRVPRDL